MKSGTSFLQQVLRHNRDGCATKACCTPSPWRRQVQAVRDVIARGGKDQPALADDGPWRSLVAEIRRWPGTAVVSMEFLGPRRARQGPPDLVEDLAPAEVEVVITVRDLARTIPAMWQESLQNRGTWTWDDYLAGVESEDRSRPGPGPRVLDAAGRPRHHRGLAGAAGRDRGHRADRAAGRVAAGRCCGSGSRRVLPVDRAGLDLDVRANPSLGLASLLVLRRAQRSGSRPTEEPSHARSTSASSSSCSPSAASPGAPGDPRLGYDAAVGRWTRRPRPRPAPRARAPGRRRPRRAALRARRRVAAGGVGSEEQLAAGIDALLSALLQLARHTGPDRDEHNSAE